MVWDRDGSTEPLKLSSFSLWLLRPQTMEGVGIKQGNVIPLSPYTEQSGVRVKNEVEQESNLGNSLEERKTSEETLRS